MLPAAPFLLSPESANQAPGTFTTCLVHTAIIPTARIATMVLVPPLSLTLESTPTERMKKSAGRPSSMNLRTLTDVTFAYPPVSGMRVHSESTVGAAGSTRQDVVITTPPVLDPPRFAAEQNPACFRSFRNASRPASAMLYARLSLRCAALDVISALVAKESLDDAPRLELICDAQHTDECYRPGLVISASRCLVSNPP